MKYKIIFLQLTLMTLSLFAAPRLFAEEEIGGASPLWKLKSTAGFDRGTYGTDAATTDGTVSLKLARTFARGALSVTLPFEVTHSSGQTTFVEGQPRKISQTKKFAKPQTEKGLGDLAADGRLAVIEEALWYPTIALLGAVKFPTASESKGLGTGKFDGGGGLSVSHKFVKDGVLYVDTTYMVIGSPAGSKLNNEWTVDAGINYTFTDRVSSEMYYEQQTALENGDAAPRRISLAGIYQWTKMYSMSTTGQAGLSSGAPAYGLDIGVSVAF